MKTAPLLLLIICLSAFTTDRRFPEFHMNTYQGDPITEAYFIGKTTIVAHFHLGCPPAMVLMKDLDSLQQAIDTSKYQILCILENTSNHLDQFYVDSGNIWSTLRNVFKIEEVHYPIITECEKEKMKTNKEGTINIGRHCRKFAKKLHTRSSPTLFLVNPEGEIEKKNKRGYIMFEPAEVRVQWLVDFLQNE